MINKYEIIKKLNLIIDKKSIIIDNQLLTKYNRDWRGFYNFKCICVVFPSNKLEIKKILLLCNKENIKIVPQGGNTSLTGASVPSKNNYEVILNLSKMNKIIRLDKSNLLIEVEAGTTLNSVKEYADKNNLYFPIEIPSSGTCQIGGNIATNAGGINALKYGTIEENLRGVEVILPDGSELNSILPIKKNNTGYKLKNLFCGSEGTLGIITKAQLKLYPKPKDYFHCFFSANSINKIINLFQKIQENYKDKLESAEIIPNIAIEQTIKHGLLNKSFFEKKYEFYLLLKFCLFEEKNSFQDFFLENLNSIKNDFEEVIIPSSIEQEKKLWEFRDNLVEAYKIEGDYITNDISVPLNKMSDFIEKTSKEIQEFIPGTRIYSFGHLGDGNIHFNMIEPINFKLNFNAYRDEIYQIVNDSVYKFGGSFSAEHGIGQIKKESLKKYKDSKELEMMKKIKLLFDSKNILNPGKIFDL